MDPNFRIAQEFRVEHRHNDGSWGSLQAEHNDSTAHDGERSWLRRIVFRCGTCDEMVAVTTGGDPDAVVDEGAR